MANRGTMLAVMLLTVVIVLDAAMADTAVVSSRVEAADHEQGRQTTTVVNGNRWWPYGWGWGWGWGIAAFVLAIVKGSILLGLFIIWAFFKSIGGHKKGGCAPIIIRESQPPVSFEHHHHHPWDRSSQPMEYARSKRSTDYQDSELYWTDLITDIGFSFLGVHSRDCRKRFVCEVDVRTKNDPMLKMATHALGVDIFRRYRSRDDKNANSFEECSQLYGKCKLPGPSISFNVFNGPVDLLQDYDDSMGGQFDEVNTEPASEYEESVTTTTTEGPNKKSYNKRKKYFRSP